MGKIKNAGESGKVESILDLVQDQVLLHPTRAVKRN